MRLHAGINFMKLTTDFVYYFFKAIFVDLFHGKLMKEIHSI